MIPSPVVPRPAVEKKAYEMMVSQQRGVYDICLWVWGTPFHPLVNHHYIILYIRNIYIYYYNILYYIILCYIMLYYIMLYTYLHLNG